MAKMLLLPWLTWQGVVLRSFAMHFQSGHLSYYLGIHGSRENKMTCHVLYREEPFDGVKNACHSFKNEIVTCIFSFFLMLTALLYMSILGHSLSDMHSSLSIPFKRFYCDAREKSSAGGCRGTPQVRSSGTVARALEPFHLPACVGQCARARNLCRVAGIRTINSTSFSSGNFANPSLESTISSVCLISSARFLRRSMLEIDLCYNVVSKR